MKEIKFRCFYRGELYDVKELSFSDGFVHVTIEMDLEGLGKRMVSCDSEHVKGLIQFTGLKDKNVKEIYEGDLLRWPGDKDHFSAYEVFFHDGDANTDFNIGYSMNRVHHHGSICGGPIPSFKPRNVNQMIVIGNIYENPELLTKETTTPINRTDKSGPQDEATEEHY